MSRRRDALQQRVRAARALTVEPKRLAALGYVKATKEAGRTHEKTVYRLIDSGREALADWLALPTPFPRIQSEANVRLLNCRAPPAGRAGWRRGGGVDEAAGVDQLIDVTDAGLDPDAEPTRYLRLSFGLGRRVIAAHREWLEE